MASNVKQTFCHIGWARFLPYFAKTMCLPAAILVGLTQNDLDHLYSGFMVAKTLHDYRVLGHHYDNILNKIWQNMCQDAYSYTQGMYSFILISIVGTQGTVIILPCGKLTSFRKSNGETFKAHFKVDSHCLICSKFYQILLKIILQDNDDDISNNTNLDIEQWHGQFINQPLANYAFSYWAALIEARQNAQMNVRTIEQCVSSDDIQLKLEKCAKKLAWIYPSLKNINTAVDSMDDDDNNSIEQKIDEIINSPRGKEKGNKYWTKVCKNTAHLNNDNLGFVKILIQLQKAAVTYREVYPQSKPHVPISKHRSSGLTKEQQKNLQEFVGNGLSNRIFLSIKRIDTARVLDFSDQV